ncbi:MAG: hypothetical protein LBJ71_02135 [Holosporaceae bacterium]|nr:hypothetical protein [Holosporaceae bacterium]
MRKTFAAFVYIALSTVISVGYEHPYGFDLNSVKTLGNVDFLPQKRVLGEPGNTNSGALLESYVFPQIAGLIRAMDGDNSFSCEKTKNAPPIPLKFRIFFDDLEHDVQITLSTLRQLPLSDAAIENDVNLDSFSQKSTKITTSLNVPQQIRSSVAEIIETAMNNERIGIGLEDSEEMGLFREINLLPLWLNGYTFGSEIIAAAENVTDALSAAFNKCGHAVAAQWLNCGKRGECFPIFFQTAALFSALKSKAVTKNEAYRMTRNLLIGMLAELRIITINKEICEKKRFKENEKVDFTKYSDFLLKGLEAAQLTPQEKRRFLRHVAANIRAFQVKSPGYTIDDYMMPTISAIIAYVDFEKAAQSAHSEEDRKQLFLLHLTRLKLVEENPTLWKNHFSGNGKTKLKEAQDFLMKKLRDAFSTSNGFKS